MPLVFPTSRSITKLTLNFLPEDCVYLLLFLGISEMIPNLTQKKLAYSPSSKLPLSIFGRRTRRLGGVNESLEPCLLGGAKHSVGREETNESPDPCLLGRVKESPEPCRLGALSESPEPCRLGELRRSVESWRRVFDDATSDVTSLMVYEGLGPWNWLDGVPNLFLTPWPLTVKANSIVAPVSLLVSEDHSKRSAELPITVIWHVWWRQFSKVSCSYLVLE